MKNADNLFKINELLKIIPNKNIQSVDEYQAITHITKENTNTAIQNAINLCNEPVLNFVKSCIEKNPKCVELEKVIHEHETLYQSDPDDNNITIVTYKKHINLMTISDLTKKRIERLMLDLSANKKKIETNEYMMQNYPKHYASDDNNSAALNMKLTSKNSILARQKDELEKHKKKWEEVLVIVKQAEQDIGIKYDDFQKYKENGWDCDYDKNSKIVTLIKKEKKFKNDIQQKIDELTLQIKQLSEQKKTDTAK